MEVVQKTRIVNNARPIDITKADLQMRYKCHFVQELRDNPCPSDRFMEKIFLLWKWILVEGRIIFKDE